MHQRNDRAMTARIDETQEERLQAVLVAAAQAPGNRQRFWAAGLLDEAGKLVADWQTAFARLRPLTKAELRSQPGQFLSQAQDIVFRGKTSGTQGDAFTYFAGAQWNQKRIEARQRSLTWWRIEQTPMLNLASRLAPVRLQDSSLVGPVDELFLQTLVQVLDAGPVVLRGYPSRLCEVVIALHHHPSRLNPEAIQAVMTTGECCFEAQRSLLQTTFSAPIINEYGCQESGLSGLSCPEGERLHLDGDRCFYEVIDGQLLTTDLYNYTLPMVRYSSGDVLDFYADPCPCGRPGPTARVLGRQEEEIAIAGQRRYPGEIELPPFAGILAYQIQLGEKGMRVWVQPETTVTPEQLAQFKSGCTAALGGSKSPASLPESLPAMAALPALEVVLESPATVLAQAHGGSAPNSVLNAVSSTTWLRQVTEQSWEHWLNQPLPWGEAQEIAVLLQELVAPRQIVTQGLSSQVRAQVRFQVRALAAPLHSENWALEALRLRVLLWATGLMAGEDCQDSALEAEALYRLLMQRIEDLAENLEEKRLAEHSALGLDLLAPLLTLERSMVRSLWPNVRDRLQQLWPSGLRPDRLTMHHYLAVLDQAGRKAQRQPHPWVPALRPLAALLLGDLSRFSAQLNGAIATAWIEMVQACPGELVWQLESEPPGELAFCQAWLVHRRVLLGGEAEEIARSLAQLFDQAQSPPQVSQAWLEKGYATLLLGDAFNLDEWLEILQPQLTTNPMPWIPLLNALAPQLAAAGKLDWAYACLFAAAPPDRHRSQFDRQTRGVNHKQSIIKGLR